MKFANGHNNGNHPGFGIEHYVHANWRYFEMYDKQGNIVDQWFGGGQDLTPYYLFDEDATHFHSICKRACDAHHPRFYSKYKEKCDTYFWNTHRNEARGVGGLFFDYCRASEEMSMEDVIETLLGLEIMDESDNVADLQLLARKNWERRAKRSGVIEQKPSPDSEQGM